MTTLSIDPLALVHNNEVVSIEKNEQVVKKKFSSFKIFKLKGPIDTNYLLNIIFPSSEKKNYDLEVSEYNGKSAKVKFYFTNGTHTDLITHLKAAAAKFFNVSENGLANWIPSDTISFKTIYQNTDENAVNQLSANGSLKDYDSTPSADDLQMYPIVDEQTIDRELDELSKKISSQISLTNYDLEKIFRKTFGRRDMTVTVSDVYNEYFTQIEGVVGLITGPADKKLIEDGEVLCPRIIISKVAGYLYQHFEHLINAGVMTEFVKDYKFGIIIALWNIFNACHSIQESYQVLLESNEEIKQILLSKKSDFKDCLSGIDQCLGNILSILADELDREKYKALQRWFGKFIKATETLMNLVKDINNKCNEKLEELESQGKDLSSKLWTVATTIGLSAMVVGGAYYYRGARFKKYEKYAMGAIAGTAAATVAAGHSLKKTMQDSIDQQTNILIQLRLVHSKLDEWKNLSREYIDYDINDINNNRTILKDEFGRVKLQCESLGEIFK